MDDRYGPALEVVDQKNKTARFYLNWVVQNFKGGFAIRRRNRTGRNHHNVIRVHGAPCRAAVMTGGNTRDGIFVSG